MSGQLPRPLYAIDNARHLRQAWEMRRLDAAGVCLFCPGVDDPAAAGRVQLHGTEHWSVLPNDFPYYHAGLHLLAVPDEHVTDLAELSPQAWADLREVLCWVREHYHLTHYGFGVRCGDMAGSGATIAHLHAHLMVARTGGPPVRFTVGAG